jgi:sugar lactone lactonase YvrE
MVPTSRLIGWLALVLATVLGCLAPAQASALDQPSDVWVAPGLRAEVFAVNLRGPEDMAWDPRGELVVLNALGRAGTVGELVRLPVRPGETLPLDASKAATLSLTTATFTPRFPISSLALHASTGDLFLAERWGTRVLRLSPDGRVVPYAVGFWRLPQRAIRFDQTGMLLVLDGRSEGRTGREEADEEEADGPGSRRYLGPILYRVSVEDRVALPRNVRYWRPVFPRDDEDRKALRGFNRFTGVAASPAGELFFITHGSGEVHRYRDGAVREFARLPPAQSSGILLAPGGELFVTSWVPGALFRVPANGGRAEAVVRGLKDPEGLAMDAEGRLYVAEAHAHRVLRIWAVK